MRLCIADPPYLGRGSRLYGGKDRRNFGRGSLHDAPPWPDLNQTHPDAHIWDRIDTHRDLIERLHREYDGWALSMARDNLHDLLPFIGPDARIAVWHKPNTPPSGARVITRWEPVAVLIPKDRRGRLDQGMQMGDVLTCPAPALGFTGAKPPAFTRWCLDMLGYDPDIDTVDDVFHGSGAVAAEVAQQVLL